MSLAGRGNLIDHIEQLKKYRDDPAGKLVEFEIRLMALVLFTKQMSEGASGKRTDDRGGRMTLVLVWRQHILRLCLLRSNANYP